MDLLNVYKQYKNILNEGPGTTSIEDVETDAVISTIDYSTYLNTETDRLLNGEDYKDFVFKTPVELQHPLLKNYSPLPYIRLYDRKGMYTDNNDMLIASGLRIEESTIRLTNGKTAHLKTSTYLSNIFYQKEYSDNVKIAVVSELLHAIAQTLNETNGSNSTSVQDLENDAIKETLYHVGDIFYHEGVPLGVVFEVTDSEVKFLSLDERREKYSDLIHGFDGRLSFYGGVHFYLPTVEEMITILKMKDRLNSIIRSIKIDKPDIYDMDEDEFDEYLNKISYLSEYRPRLDKCDELYFQTYGTCSRSKEEWGEYMNQVVSIWQDGSPTIGEEYSTRPFPYRIIGKKVL